MLSGKRALQMRRRGTASPSAPRARRRASSAPAPGAPSSALSSRTSPSSGSLLLLQQLGDLLDQLGLLHLVGNLGDDDLPGAVLALLDRPSARARGSRRGRSRRRRGSPRASSTSTPPVGKSGPGMCRSRSAVVACGWRIRWIAAAQTSPALCGGIEVAMPTAMPAAPLASRLGNAAGQHDRLASPRRRRWGGNRPRPRRCRPAARCATSVSRASV